MDKITKKSIKKNSKKTKKISSKDLAAMFDSDSDSE